jgi:hypothetical protein
MKSPLCPATLPSAQPLAWFASGVAISRFHSQKLPIYPYITFSLDQSKTAPKRQQIALSSYSFGLLQNPMKKSV